MNKLAQIITKIIDFFYTPFRKIMSEQLFRYAACGGGNMVLDWILYFLIYNFVIGHELVNVQFTIYNVQFAQAITPHIATLCIVFPRSKILYVQSHKSKVERIKKTIKD